ncbi:MAG: bifunctional UDP-N-acetylglucosamine diphosphorylase/glucosamine-1-phosphate N-acetyltransferase GlmU, partial [Bacilli bacterium]|nr:bifunctional UDP-N-acetylglucosamine diphosphorylase/glucosamine-1-phosphate N-acetyltransferase GlmU [Bacilli bacterium]
VKRIVENSEASPEILNIKEVNSGLYCVDVGLLFWALDLVKNENAKKEYFLTDIIEILAKDHKVDGYVVKEGQYLMGINDLEALKKAEDLFK